MHDKHTVQWTSILLAAVTCWNPPKIANSTMDSNHATYPDFVTYTCREEHLFNRTLQTVRSRCLEDGEWEVSEDQECRSWLLLSKYWREIAICTCIHVSFCIPGITCPPFPMWMNIQAINSTRNTLGDVINYTCQSDEFGFEDGRDDVRIRTTTCYSNASWCPAFVPCLGKHRTVQQSMGITQLLHAR